MRSLLAVVAGLVLATGLVGCGDPIHQYCRALDEAQPQFAQMAEDPTGLLAHRPLLRQLAAKAPRDMADDWHVFTVALDEFAAAASRAGIDLASFTGPDELATLPQHTRDELARAAGVLAAPDVAAAANEISQHAADVCKIQIGLG